MGVVRGGDGCDALTPDCNVSLNAKVNPSTSIHQARHQGEIVSDFADQVIILNYELLMVKAEDLSAAVSTLVKTPTAAESLKMSQTAWIEACTLCSQSEAFAFGPAESLGYDGDLDDWPVN